VLAHQAISSVAKAKLAQLLATADPVVLLTEIRAAQEELGRRVDQRGMGTLSGEPIESSGGPDVAPLAARSGEQRAIHRRPYRRRQPVPRRAHMLDAYEDQARNWLKRQPGMTAVEILGRLQELAPPGTFTDKHLRTVQRALATWRADAIRQWIDQCRREVEMSGSPPLETAAL